MSSENVDRLSTLPDEIRSHILSLMPTKFAVRTSVLSKRWRYVWMFVTNLDFDDNYFSNALKSPQTFVDRLLKFRVTSQVNLFRFRSHIWSGEKSVVSKWINKVVRLNVRELDIDVVHLGLPLSFFTCKTLTKLRLRLWDDDEFSCHINLPCLKTLHIVLSGKASVNAFKLISGSPMLEDLSLIITPDNGKQDYIFNIPTLKRLKLATYDRSTFNRVVLRVPNLEYLFVGGDVCSFFVVDDMLSLVEAAVLFLSPTYDHIWIKLLKGISGVKSLAIDKYTRVKPLPIFPNMKHLMLQGLWYSEEILQVLESCPRLKHLHIEKPVDYDRITLKLVPACMLTNLTTIKFRICGQWKYDIKFLEYMLGNAAVLKTVTIIREDLCINEELLFCSQLLKIPRASRSCEIHFHGSMPRSIGS